MVAIFGWIVAVLQGLAATTAIVLWRAVDGFKRRGARRLAPLPSLIVVRPIRGLEPGLAANVRAALAQRYPGALETIFDLDDTSDPAYPVVRRLDTRPAPTLLAELARAVVAQPDVGAAFAPAVTVSGPRTVGDVGYTACCSTESTIPWPRWR